MSKTGVFSMSPIPDIEQLWYLPLKARFCDCFFRPEQNADRKKYWTGWRAGRVLRRNEGKSRPSWWCKSLYRICHSTATKDKNSLFLEGLVIRINGHFGFNQAPHTHQRWFFSPACLGYLFLWKGTVTRGETIIKRAFPGMLTKKQMKFPPYIPPWPS